MTRSSGTQKLLVPSKRWRKPSRRCMMRRCSAATSCGGGILSRVDVARLGEAVLDTPMTDAEFRQLAGLQRAYSAGALALTQGYIHSREPATRARAPQDIRNFFPSTPRPTATSRGPSALQSDGWIRASHTCPALPPTGHPASVGLQNRFLELDLSEDDESAITSPSPHAPGSVPQLHKTRKRDSTAKSLFQMVRVGATTQALPDVAMASLEPSQRDRTRLRPHGEPTGYLKRRRYNIVDSDDESTPTKVPPYRPMRDERRKRARFVQLSKYEKRLALAAGFRSVTRWRLVSAGILRDTRDPNSVAVGGPTGIG